MLKKLLYLIPLIFGSALGAVVTFIHNPIIGLINVIGVIVWGHELYRAIRPGNSDQIQAADHV